MEKRNRKAGSRYSLRDRILAQIMIVLVTVTMLPYESLVVHAASTTTVKSIGSIQTEYEVDNGTPKDEIGLPSYTLRLETSVRYSALGGRSPLVLILHANIALYSRHAATIHEAKNSLPSLKRKASMLPVKGVLLPAVSLVFVNLVYRDLRMPVATVISSVTGMIMHRHKKVSIKTSSISFLACHCIWIKTGSKQTDPRLRDQYFGPVTFTDAFLVMPDPLFQIADLDATLYIFIFTLF